MENFDAIVAKFSAARTNEARVKVASMFYAPHAHDKGMEQSFREVKDVTNFKSKQVSAQLRTEGNIAYQKGDYNEALNLYTKSIASAPFHSLELALAFANRSAVLRAAGKCTECLLDIEQALIYGYPTDKSFKLLLREMQCHRDLKHEAEVSVSFNKAFSLLQSLPGLTAEERAALQQQLDKEKQAPCKKVCTEEVIYPEHVPELSYGANPEVLGASSAVRILYNCQHGRHLVATRDIEIGDVLLIGEHLVVALRDDFRFNHCAHCHKLCHNLLPCPNCVLALFCSDECQTDAEEKYHDAECAALSRMRHIISKTLPLGMSNMDLYDRVIRVIAMIGINNLQPYLKYARETNRNESNETKRTKGFNSHGVFDPTNLDMIFNLHSGVDEQDAADLVMNCLFYMQIPRCFGMAMSNRDYFAVEALCMQLMYTSFLVSSSKTYITTMPIQFIDTAVCFNPLNSLVKHSCVANTASVTYGNTCVTMAKCPIAEGTILTQSLLNADLRFSKTRRNHILKQQYIFDCFCDACIHDSFYKGRLQCISDPTDVKLANDMFSFDEEKIVDLPSSQIDKFKKERYDLLTKLWNKGEFHDFRFNKVQHHLAVYNSLQGNRVVYPGKQDSVDQLANSITKNTIN